MKETRTYGELDNNGRLKIFRKPEFMQSLRVLFGDSKATSIRVEVIVKKLYRKRSNPQNNYLHGVIVSDFMEGFKNTTGDDITHDDAFGLLKYHCHYKEHVNEQTGEVMRILLSTSNQTTVEFEEMCQRMREFIFNWFGIVVLLPNEQSEIIFNEN